MPKVRIAATSKPSKAETEKFIKEFNEAAVAFKEATDNTVTLLTTLIAGIVEGQRIAAAQQKPKFEGWIKL